MLTTKLIRTAKPGMYTDSKNGLYLRVSKSGRKSWMLQFMFGTGTDRKNRKITFGEWPDLSLSGARERAIQYKAMIADGRHPHDDHPLLDDNVREVVELHIAEHCSKLRSGRNPARALRRELAEPYGHLSISQLGAEHIRAAIARIQDRGSPVEAARFYSYAHRFFSWAVKTKGLVASNPVALVEKPKSGASTRDRVLSDNEVTRVWTALQHNNPGDSLIKLLLLTGCRQGEIANLKWGDVNLDERYFTLRNTKNGDTRDVPLSPSAFAVINGLPVMGEYVVSTTGDRPYSGFSQLTKRIQRDSSTSDWRQHDLRRTVGTGLQRLGTDREVIRAVLGHRHYDAATPIYLRHTFFDEARDALSQWDRHIVLALAGEQQLTA
ncbi:tyrosine-type recombinase/integrase [Ruegeria sp. HKCCD7221]|uniref:tyrosine-type recombinase/integrase n=1 Tax=Ruegeria sp. HKCCD7221 TaxID=2683009 RepID=UPI001488B3D3|nr:tyrosine-type recombinase/integrase [Ruegeria sp. HKCCD7221]